MIHRRGISNLFVFSEAPRSPRVFPHTVLQHFLSAWPMTTTASPPPMKKARAGIPMELEMALPFLSATEDLPGFATLSKACRDAAGDSYRRRINNDAALLPPSIGDDDDGSPLGLPPGGLPIRIFPKGKEPPCYRKPWWDRKQDVWMHNGDNHAPLAFRDDGSWIVEEDDDITRPQWLVDQNSTFHQWLANQKLVFPAKHHELFDNGDTDVVHLSIVDGLLLVILCRWTDRGAEEYNAEETRKQLFAVLYDLSPSSSSSSSSASSLPSSNPQQEAQRLPLFCHELTEPRDRNNYGSVDSIHFGNGERSRNGRVVAVVTALPLGNEDNADDDEPRETAEITVYDVTRTALEKRHSIEIPMGSRTVDSMLTMAISNGGGLLSINTTQDEADSEYGDWEVHNVLAATGKAAAVPLVRVEEVRHHFLSHRFTPDNELLIVLPDEADAEAFFEETKIPTWLAERMIVIQVNYQEYYADDEDDE